MALSALSAKLHKLWVKGSLPFALAGALLVAPVIGQAHAENPPQAYLFKQKSVIQGASELLLSPLGVKLTLSDRHLVIFMRPPLWHVQYFDSRSKRYYEGTKEEFREPFARTISVTKPSSCTGLAIKSSKPATFMNLPAKEFALVNPVHSEEKRTRSWEIIAVRSGTFTGFEDATAKIVGRTVCQVYAMPHLDSVPLLVVVKNYRDDISNELETSSVKKVTATAADFVVPAHSTQVAKTTDVAAEYEIDSSLTEMLK